MRSKVASLLLALGVLIDLCLAEARQEERPAPNPALRIPRVSRAPKLEDFLTDTPRQAEAVVTDFRQFTPGDGTPASQRTTVYLSYDEENLYVVFVCKDDPRGIRARLVRREDIMTDDVVGLDLDTFQDRRRAYFFFSNPLGVQMDGTFTEGQIVPDLSFDTLWYSRGQLTADGYIVWMAIPFKSLRFPDRAGQRWGIALVRGIFRDIEFSMWPYVTRSVQGLIQQFATLEGLENISPGRNLQFIPYGSLAAARFLDRSVPQFRSESEPRGGLDAKVVLRDAFTLDLTFNPDFSQVESDEPQVTLNQRFEVFFPEKRPFFIENSGFFQLSQTSGFPTFPPLPKTAENFFTRRIVDPQFGARLTGKTGDWALGALVTDDRAPGRSLSAGDSPQEGRATTGVLRLQREFAEQSSVGFFMTTRDFASSSNRVFALDTQLKLTPNWNLDGQIMSSTTRTLEGEDLSGPSYFGRLRYSGQNFFYAASYLDRGPDFRSQLGFIPRTDIRQVENLIEYRWRPERRRVSSFGPRLSLLANWNRQNRLQDWQVRPAFAAEIKGPILFEIARSEAFELFDDYGFRNHSTELFLFADWKQFGLQAIAQAGKSINFFPAPGLPAFPADSLNAVFGFNLRLSSRLRLDQIYVYSRLKTRPQDPETGARMGREEARRLGLQPVAPAASIFNNHVLRSRLNYQFTRELSLRLIVDYNAVLPNRSLVDLEREKRLTADLLFTYLVHPGTALFVGYTDGYENLLLQDTRPPTLGRTDRPSTSTGRQFFIKLSYLFRF